MRRYILLTAVVALVLLLLMAGTAFAAFPTNPTNSQYTALEATLQEAAPEACITPETFIAIFNQAAVDGVSGFSPGQIAAAGQVLRELAPFQSLLPDFTTVFNTIGAGTNMGNACVAPTAVAAAATGPSGISGALGPLPSTGVAIALLAGSGLVGLGAGSRLLRRRK